VTKKLSSRRVPLVVGMLVLLVGLSIVNAPFAKAADEIVSADHDADWHMRHTTCGGSSESDQAFVSGPVGTPGDEVDGDLPGDEASGGPPGTPDTTGSLRFRTGADGEALEEIRNTRFGDRLLSSLQHLTYWTYIQSAPLPPGDFIPAVYLGLDIDTDGNGTRDDSLVFEPDYQQEDDDDDQSSTDPAYPDGADSQHAVTPGTWQQWIAKDIDSSGLEGKWYLKSDGDESPPDRVFRSIEKWAASNPLWKIVNPTATLDSDPLHAGGVYLAAGCGGAVWDGFVGYTDEVIINFPSNATTFDMEPRLPTAAVRLDCGDESSVNPVAKSHLINCTARDSQNNRVSGVRIDGEATGVNDANGDSPTEPDFTCTTSQDNPATVGNDGGSCTLRHGGSGFGTTLLPGSTEYRIWIDEDGQNVTVEADAEEGPDESTDPGSRPEGTNGDDTDVLTKTWVPRLDCELETVTQAPNTARTITCTVTDGASNRIPNINVDVEMSGVNDVDASTSYNTPDMFCNTDSQGTCPVIHGPASGGVGTTTATGRTTYRAWVDHDNNNATWDPDQQEGRSETTSPGASEVDYTDVVETTWATSGASPSPGATQSASPTPTPCPTPSGASPTPCPSRTPTPTPSASTTSSPSPSPSPSETPDGDPLLSGPCAGFFPDSRQPRSGGGQVIVGTSGSDDLRGSNGNDVICGLGGGDTIEAGRGRDSVFAGSGPDLAHGGNGHDRLHGGRGRDELHGGKGDDRLFGGAGSDDCTGGHGSNRLKTCE
jgi:Ca2+-binding RTX toxin-like protein